MLMIRFKPICIKEHRLKFQNGNSLRDDTLANFCIQSTYINMVMELHVWTEAAAQSYSTAIGPILN